LDFWFENIPSGNPGMKLADLNEKLALETLRPVVKNDQTLSCINQNLKGWRFFVKLPNCGIKSLARKVQYDNQSILPNFLFSRAEKWRQFWRNKIASG
jgi:hypothetical protein